MRDIKYLSFSSLAKFEEDVDEWCLRYATEDRPDREPQGLPASVGSAFDARVKAHMYDYSYGKGYMPEKYSYEALFEKQVEPQNRDFAGPAGDHVFECYQVSGFLNRLKTLAGEAVEPPQYEFRVERTVGGVPLLGLPDGYFKLPNCSVVFDMKVNGYCSKSPVSPNPGFILCRDGYVAQKQSRSHDTSHKAASKSDYRGVTIGGFMEDASEAWASQLTGYGWCLGEEIGSENVVLMIHQVVAKPIADMRPILRFAEFAGPVRTPFQEFLLTRYQRVWNAIQNDHLFLELTKEESQRRFELISKQGNHMVGNPDDLLTQLTRPKWRGY
jgi:hypothetical protein